MKAVFFCGKDNILDLSDLQQKKGTSILESEWCCSKSINQKNYSFLRSARKKWKDKKSSDFSSVVMHFLRTEALNSLKILYSRNHRPFLWHMFDQQLDVKFFLTDSLIRLAGSFNREKEEKDEFSLEIRYPRSFHGGKWQLGHLKQLEQQSRAFSWNLFGHL